MENVEIPSEILEKANAATAGIIPEKSKSIYNKELKEFQDWKIKGVKGVNEDVLLAYFFNLSKKLAPSTLWTKYSMLKSTLRVYKNIEISKFGRLVAFLKSKHKHFQPKKSKVLEKEQIEQFLREALDKDHLMNKVGSTE
uniref:Uncharacterized protein n=1 Tax=Anoplophora glabripennis TaxID=217634 RepID=V5GRG2_ANOGL